MKEFDDMEDKYGGAFAQDIRDRLAACAVKEIHYFELKQMNDLIMPRYRKQAREMVKTYRLWKAGYDAAEDRLERVYRAYEGIFIRQQLRDALKLYWLVNKDYHEMRRIYLEKLFQFKSSPYHAAA